MLDFTVFCLGVVMAFILMCVIAKVALKIISRVTRIGGEEDRPDYETLPEDPVESSADAYRRPY